MTQNLSFPTRDHNQEDNARSWSGRRCGVRPGPTCHTWLVVRTREISLENKHLPQTGHSSTDARRAMLQWSPRSDGVANKEDPMEPKLLDCG